MKTYYECRTARDVFNKLVDLGIQHVTVSSHLPARESLARARVTGTEPPDRDLPGRVLMRYLAERERELDAREDAEGNRSTPPGFSEMEARLRRLEQQQQDPREQTLGFSGGLRKLEQGSRQQRPG